MAEADDGAQHALVALFRNEAAVERAVHRLIDRDFPMDMLSLLGKAHSSGDDPLGLYHTGTGERVKGWGGMGALWGGLLGFLTGAAGLFLLPGIGPLFAAGPIVEAIVGAAAGAGIGGGVMAGAAALSHLAVVMRRIGLPEDKLEAMHQAIADGGYVVMLRVATEEAARWRGVLTSLDADELMEFPFRSLID